MKYKIVTILFLWAPALFGQISLNSTLDEARKNSIFYHEAVRDYQVSNANFGFYSSWLKPQVSLNLVAPNYFKTSREIIQPNGTIQFQSISQNNSSLRLSASQILPMTGGSFILSTDLQRFDDFGLDQQLYNGIPLRIGLSQPLNQFNPWKWDQKIEPLKVDIAKRKYVIDIERINMETVQRYFDLLLAQENLNIASKNREINNKLLEIAEERFSLGKISQNDRLQLSLEYKNALRNYTRAEYEVQSEYLKLMTYLKVFPKDDTPIASIPEPLELLTIDAQVALKEGRTNRPEWLEYRQQLLEANRDIEKAGKDYGLQANVFASFGFARGSMDLSEIYSDPITEQQVQLSVSIPILDWGKRKNAIGIAEAEKRYTEQAIEQDQLIFENEILRLVNLFNQLQKEVITQKEIVAVTEDRFNISNQRYILGDISTTDLTIAQREKDQARRQYVATLREYWSAFYELRALTGYDFYNNQNIRYNIN